MKYCVYLDESGDLGWKFDQPYMKGGSSRFLTIAFFVCPFEKRHLLKKIVTKTYKVFNLNKTLEVKGSKLPSEVKKYVAKTIVKLLGNHPDIKMTSITVSKENVQQHIRSDANKLYNYMIKCALADQIKEFDEVWLIRDNRTIKVASGNSLIDYLQIHLLFELQSKVILSDHPSDSSQIKNLILADWLNNMIWVNYEKENSDGFNILNTKLLNKQLFFN